MLCPVERLLLLFRKHQTVLKHIFLSLSDHMQKCRYKIRGSF